MKSDMEGDGPTAGLDYDDDHVLRAPVLRFAVSGSPHGGGEDSLRLIAAVDAAMERRDASGHPDVEALEINFVYSSSINMYLSLPSRGCWYILPHRHSAGITSAHVTAWLRFAERRVTGSFTLAVPTLTGPEMKALAAHEKKRFAELPASARAEAMSLSLGHATLAVPAAGNGAFHALTDLFLGQAHIDPGSAGKRNLGPLLSASCCPRLRRLRLEHITGLAALRLDAAATLEELRLDQIHHLASLELDAAGLRELHVDGCFRLLDGDATARISAPRLEVLACAEVCHPDRLQFDGAAAVRCLEKIYLWSHWRRDDHSNDGAVWLLQHCTGAVSLGVHLGMPWDQTLKQWDDIQEMTSHVPQLPNITNLTIEISPGHWHNLKAIIAGLITKCSRLERLSINIECANDACSKPQCFCNGKEDEKISMEHLREAKFTSFRSSKYHMSFVQLMMEAAPALERMTVEGKDLDCISIPGDRGHWAPCLVDSSKRFRTKAYEWTSDNKREEDEEVKGRHGHIFSRF